MAFTKDSFLLLKKKHTQDYTQVVIGLRGKKLPTKKIMLLIKAEKVAIILHSLNAFMNIIGRKSTLKLRRETMTCMKNLGHVLVVIVLTVDILHLNLKKGYCSMTK